MSLKTLASLTRCAMPRDYYGNHYLYGASPERVAEEISKLEMRRAEERAAGIDKRHRAPHRRGSGGRSRPSTGNALTAAAERRQFTGAANVGELTAHVAGDL
jgi:hypothetical protein